MNAIELLHQLALTLSNLGYQRLKEQRMRGEIQNKIEEIREREAETKEARAYAEAIIANITDPLWVVDKADNWVLVNEAMKRVTGYEEKELLGKPTFQQPLFKFYLTLPRSKERFSEFREQIKRGGRVPSITIPWLAKDNKMLIFSSSGEPLKDARGNVIGGVFIGKDMSVLHRAGITTTRALNRLMEAKAGELGLKYELGTLMFLSNATIIVGDSSLEILKGTVEGYNRRFSKSIGIEEGIALTNMLEEEWPSFLEFLLSRFYECIGPPTFECCEGIKCIENVVEKVKTKYGDAGKGL
jgi:PAS domain S-box-containing protein